MRMGLVYCTKQFITIIGEYLHGVMNFFIPTDLVFITLRVNNIKLKIINYQLIIENDNFNNSVQRHC